MLCLNRPGFDNTNTNEPFDGLQMKEKDHYDQIQRLAAGNCCGCSAIPGVACGCCRRNDTWAVNEANMSPVRINDRSNI
jgi:hypothetical protein